MQYRTVFDVAAVGYKNWYFPASGGMFIAIGLGLVLGRKSLVGPWAHNPKTSSAFAFIWLGFAVLWTCVAFTSTYREFNFLTRSASDGSARTVEGIVTDFKPMPITGHSMERFCVSEVCFEYSDFVLVGGFNQTASHGGPIHEGLRVRIKYVNNSILKLEVAE